MKPTNPQPIGGAGADRTERKVFGIHDARPREDRQ